MTRQLRHISPLRYPGGKARLAPFVAAIFERNGLCDGHYAEPYAGGAGIALSLLSTEHARIVHINDIDRGVYAFWRSVMESTDALCRLITDARLDLDEWGRQRSIYLAGEANLLELGFATFYLNRTNRSGIIGGGAIGGVAQKSQWGLDARFNRQDLVQRVQRCAAFRDRVLVSNIDALDFLARGAAELPERGLTYCDPPYFVKGTRRLYTNWYQPADHLQVAETLASYPHPWLVSYDATDEIRSLYEWAPGFEYDLNYSANERYRGMEAMFHSPELRLPGVGNPAYINSRRRPGGWSALARATA